jgi:hypothetical protein
MNHILFMRDSGSLKYFRVPNGMKVLWIYINVRKGDYVEK